MKIVVSRTELAAAMLFASNDDSRYVINGILVEVQPGRKPVMVATDGRRLISIETEAEQAQDFDESYAFILKPDAIRAFLSMSKSFGGKMFPWICFETHGSKRIVVTLIGGKISLDVEEGALIEGEFPAWRKCIPAKSKKREPITDLGVNAEFIGDFARAAKLLGAESPIVQMNLVGKEQSIEVKLAGINSFYGLLMQCKIDESIEYQPEFLGIVKDFPKEDDKREPEPFEPNEEIPSTAVAIRNGHVAVARRSKRNDPIVDV